MLPVNWEFLLSDRDGTTHLVQRSVWRPGLGPLGALFMLFRRRQVPVENRTSLERIKAALEKVRVSKSRAN